MPDPTRPHEPDQPAQPAAPTPTGKQDKSPGHEVEDGDLQDSAAGEEDPGAAVDSLVPRH